MTYLIGAALFVLVFAGLACLVHAFSLAIEAMCPEGEADTQRSKKT